MADDIPQWARERAAEIVNALGYGWAAESIRVGQPHEAEVMREFARYIAEHEEPPVDPLLIEAREIAAGYCVESQIEFQQAVRDFRAAQAAEQSE